MQQERAHQPNRRASIMLALIFGLSAAVPFSLTWLVGRANAGPLETMGLVFYAVVFFIVVCYGALVGLVLPSLRRLGWRKVPWLVACLTMGSLIVAGLRIEVINHLPTFHRLEVVNTGTRNQSALGAETWLIDWPTGVTGAPDSLQEQGWRSVEASYVATGDNPAAIFLSGWFHDGDTVTFRTHQWSGIVQYRWDESPYQYADLYSPDLNEIRIAAPIAAWELPEPLLWLLTACVSLSLGGVVGGLLAVSADSIARRRAFS